MKRCVFTYIFGKNQEILRDPLVIDDDTEYICVTDQLNLESKIWKIIYEPLPMISSLRDKVALVKFNPFKYTDADYVLIQDSSHQIKESLDTLFNELDSKDILLKRHTEVSNLEDELGRWIKIRHMPVISSKKIKMLSAADGISLNDIPVYECCLLCIKNNEMTKRLFSSLLTLMRMLGDGKTMIMTQQCTFAYLLRRLYNDINIGLINHNRYFIRFRHNSNQVHNT